MKNISEKPANIDEKYVISTVVRAFDIIDLFWEKEAPITITEVSEGLDINSNMAYRLLKTLEKTGYITQDPTTSMYHLTLKVLKLSRIALNTVEIRRQAMPYLQPLAEAFKNQANINLAVLEQGEVLVIARIDSEKLPRTNSHVGKRLPPHATALGKVLLSEFDEERLRDFFENNSLKKFTEKTISEIPELKKELDKVRREGLAWDIEEHMPQVNCVAVPIRNGKRQIVASVSISAFDYHMAREQLEEASVRLREAATSISHAMGLLI